jgi:hypothetical protein
MAADAVEDISYRGLSLARGESYYVAEDVLLPVLCRRIEVLNVLQHNA